MEICLCIPAEFFLSFSLYFLLPAVPIRAIGMIRIAIVMTPIRVINNIGMTPIDTRTVDPTIDMTGTDTTGTDMTESQFSVAPIDFEERALDGDYLLVSKRSLSAHRLSV